MASSVRVAAVQAEPAWLDQDATTDKTVELIRQAAEGGADLVAFPEVWLPGYPVFAFAYPVPAQLEFIARYRANSVSIDSPQIARVRAAARANGITCVVGFSEKDHGSLYIAQAVIGPDGELLHHRRKLKPTFVERAIFGEGDGSGLRVLDTPLGRVGALNCWEHLQPLVKYAMYAQHEQIHVASWPCGGILGQVPNFGYEATMSANQTYALEGSVFVVVSTQTMSDSGAMVFAVDSNPCPVYTGGGGYARVYGPDSRLLTEPLDATTEGIVYADLDLGQIDLAKAFADPVGHYARPDVFDVRINQSPRSPAAFTEDPAPDGEIEATFAAES